MTASKTADETVIDERAVINLENAFFLSEQHTLLSPDHVNEIKNVMMRTSQVDSNGKVTGNGYEVYLFFYKLTDRYGRVVTNSLQGASGIVERTDEELNKIASSTQRYRPPQEHKMITKEEQPHRLSAICKEFTNIYRACSPKTKLKLL